MRIAVISTVYHRTPPLGYGGIERVVHSLVEELVRSGHEVTMFATPGSQCSGTTVEVRSHVSTQSIVHSARDMRSEESMYDTVSRHLSEHPVDIIHDWSFQNLFVSRHPERFPFLVSVCIPGFVGESCTTNRVASCAAHAQMLDGNVRFVRYGLPLANWEFDLHKGSHFVHIAKIARYKAQHEAIQAARKSGKELVLVGNVEDRRYYYTRVKPRLLLSRNVRYIGETHDTNSLLRDSACLIQTPRWFDAFPLIVLEALASATPVISYEAGGVAEQIEHGVNGFLCHDVGELAEMMGRIGEIDPRRCREFAEEHFSVSRMAAQYLELYRRAIDGETW